MEYCPKRFLRIILVAAALSSGTCSVASTRCSSLVPLLLAHPNCVVAELPFAQTEAPDAKESQLIAIRKEIARVASSLHGLRSEQPSFWKRIEPYVLTFISTLLAIVSAYGAFLLQEVHRYRVENLRTANKWLLNGTVAYASLERYKSVYANRIKPGMGVLERMMAVPEFKLKKTEIAGHFSELAFLLSAEPDPNGWDQLPRIRAMFENLELAENLWEIHSQNHARLAEALLSLNGRLAFDSVHIDQLRILINEDHSWFVNHILVTEQAIKLTDDLLVNLVYLLARCRTW